MSPSLRDRKSVAAHVYAIPLVIELASDGHPRALGLPEHPPSDRIAAHSPRDEHTRQRARVQASLLLSCRRDRPTHRRWA
jgi:hypothetical protein